MRPGMLRTILQHLICRTGMSHTGKRGTSLAQAAGCMAVIGKGYSSQHVAVKGFIIYLSDSNIISMGWANSGEFWTLLLLS